MFQGLVNNYVKNNGFLWFYNVSAICTIGNYIKLKENYVFRIINIMVANIMRIRAEDVASESILDICAIR